LALIGTLSKGSNVLNNAKQLTKTGVRNEVFSAAVQSVPPLIGGALQYDFPKRNGSGQSNTTAAKPYGS
jgi:hypothetical protein